jgi:hypothetical protein
LEKEHVIVEADDEGVVLWARECVGEEGFAGYSLLRKEFALAAAGIDHEADGEWKVFVLGEVVDGLGFAVVGQSEVVFGEMVDEFAGVIVHQGVDGDDANIDRESGCGWFGFLGVSQGRKDAQHRECELREAANET